MAARKKKTSKKKSVAKKKGTAVSTYQSRLAEFAEQEEQREKSSGGAKLSIKGSKFRFQGDDLGRELDVVILDYAFVNTYYDTPFDEDEPSSPACFAISREGEEAMEPADGVPNQQEESCNDCWAAQFKSDARGRGKACRNSRRLALIHVDDLESLDDEPQVVYLSVPPTSLSAFRGYVKKLSKGLKRPPFGVITKLSFDMDADYETLEFECVDALPDELLDGIFELRDNIQDDLLALPDFGNYTGDGEKGDSPKPKRGSKKKATKKKATKKSGSKFGR